MQESDFDDSTVKAWTSEQLKSAKKAAPVELPQEVEKNSPRKKIVRSVEQLGQMADREIAQIDGQFTDSVSEKPGLKAAPEAVLSSSERWENYLIHQEEIEDKLAQLQEQYEAAKAGSKAFKSTSASPNPQEVDQTRLDALYQEVVNFQISNIPSELLGLYKIPPELRDKPLGKEYMKRVEVWKKFASDERDRFRKKREYDKIPGSIKDELSGADQEAETQRERADEVEAALKEAQEEIEKLKNEMSGTEQEAETQRKRADEAEERATRAEKERDTAKQLAEQYKGERDAANLKLDQERLARIAAERRLEMFEHMPQTEAEWAQMPEWIRKLYQGFADQQTIIAEQQAQIAEFEARNAKIRGLGKLVGATAMGVLAGTVGAATVGWVPTAVVLGAAQSGIRRFGEIRKSEGMAQIMGKEWDSGETVSGRFKGARRLLSAYVNAENVAGVWGTRVMNRLFEVGDPEAAKCRDFLAEIVQRGGNRDEVLAGMRDFFGEEEAAIREGTEPLDDNQINERSAQQLALITSQSLWEYRMGSYKIFDILKKQGVAMTREQVDEQTYSTYAAFNDLCNEYIDKLPDSDFKDSLIQTQSEQREGRYRTLMATYFVAGTAMGAVKALDVASLFHLDQLGKGFEAWRSAFSPHPVGAANGAMLPGTPPTTEKIVSAVTQNTAKPTTPLTPSPETTGGTATLTEVKPGDTWGGLLKEKHGYSGPELWGSTLKSGEIWSSGYVDALADPRNAQQIINAGHTAAAAYPDANAVLTGLGIDINAGTIDTAKLAALKLGLSSPDASIREMALRFTKNAATVLRPGNIYLK